MVATIPLEVKPKSATYDSGMSEIFVTNQDNTTFTPNSVLVISDTNNSVVANITVGIGPGGAAYDWGTNEVYVPNMGSNTVSVISDRTNTVVTTIPVQLAPGGGITYDSDRNLIYVINDQPGTVSIISDSNHTVIKTIALGGWSKSAVYDSGKGEVFVTGGGVVAVISDSQAFDTPSTSSSPNTVIQGQIFTLTSTAVTTGISPYSYQWAQ